MDFGDWQAATFKGHKNCFAGSDQCLSTPSIPLKETSQVPLGISQAQHDAHGHLVIGILLLGVGLLLEAILVKTQ